MHMALFFALFFRAITEIHVKNDPYMATYYCNGSHRYKPRVDVQTATTPTQDLSTQYSTVTINPTITTLHQPDRWDLTNFYAAENVLFGFATTMAIGR